MEHAPLRPVPGRPTQPVSEPEAVARVEAALPELAERERVALALAALAGTPRPQVAARLGIGEAELAGVLAAARKQLRRTVSPLPGSGWCERAERLISDRMDGALAEADEPRLSAHERNCPRCVEHERKLVQATDALVDGAAPQPSAPVVAEAPQAEAGRAEAEAAPPAENAPPAEAAPPAENAPPAARPALAAVADRSAADRSAATSPAPDAPPARRSPRELAGAVGWTALIVFAVLLALAALGLALAGALGAQL
jgi:hypothetical protein